MFNVGRATDHPAHKTTNNFKATPSQMFSWWRRGKPTSKIKNLEISAAFTPKTCQVFFAEEWTFLINFFKSEEWTIICLVSRYWVSDTKYRFSVVFKLNCFRIVAEFYLVTCLFWQQFQLADRESKRDWKFFRQRFCEGFW